MDRISGIFCCLAFAAGCSGETHPAQKALSKSDYEALKQEFAQPSGGRVESRTYPVRQGALPLAYLVVSDSTIRVLDSTTGSVIATADAPANSIVSLDAGHGVTIAGQNVMPGPLASAHQYAIYVEARKDLPPQPAPTTAPSR